MLQRALREKKMSEEKGNVLMSCILYSGVFGVGKSVLVGMRENKK